MRWNGENDSDLGYPIGHGKPMWFQIDDALTLPILSSLVGLDNSNKLEIISVLTRIYQE